MGEPPFVSYAKAIAAVGRAPTLPRRRSNAIRRVPETRPLHSDGAAQPATVRDGVTLLRPRQEFRCASRKGSHVDGRDGDETRARCRDVSWPVPHFTFGAMYRFPPRVGLNYAWTRHENALAGSTLHSSYRAQAYGRIAFPARQLSLAKEASGARAAGQTANRNFRGATERSNLLTERFRAFERGSRVLSASVAGDEGIPVLVESYARAGRLQSRANSEHLPGGPTCEHGDADLTRGEAPDGSELERLEPLDVDIGEWRAPVPASGARNRYRRTTERAETQAILRNHTALSLRIGTLVSAAVDLSLRYAAQLVLRFVALVDKIGPEVGDWAYQVAGIGRWRESALALHEFEDLVRRGRTGGFRVGKLFAGCLNGGSDGVFVGAVGRNRAHDFGIEGGIVGESFVGALPVVRELEFSVSVPHGGPAEGDAAASAGDAFVGVCGQVCVQMRRPALGKFVCVPRPAWRESEVECLVEVLDCGGGFGGRQDAKGVDLVEGEAAQAVAFEVGSGVGEAGQDRRDGEIGGVVVELEKSVYGVSREGLDFVDKKDDGLRPLFGGEVTGKRNEGGGGRRGGRCRVRAA